MDAPKELNTLPDPRRQPSKRFLPSKVAGLRGSSARETASLPGTSPRAIAIPESESQRDVRAWSNVPLRVGNGQPSGTRHDGVHEIGAGQQSFRANPAPYHLTMDRGRGHETFNPIQRCELIT